MCAAGGKIQKRPRAERIKKKHITHSTHTFNIYKQRDRTEAREVYKLYMTSFSWLYLCYIVEIQEIWSACLIGALGVVHTPREERTNLKEYARRRWRRDVHCPRCGLPSFRRSLIKFFLLELRGEVAVLLRTIFFSLYYWNVWVTGSK